MRSKKILTFVIILLAAISFPSDVFDASDNDGLRIYEVIPWGKAEGVSLYNYGQHDVDLKNYYLDDTEGTVKFTLSIIVKPGASVTILATYPDELIAETRTVMVYGENGIVAKNFQLNDKGDEVILRTSSGNVIDVFVYGTGNLIDGWNGDAFGDIPTNKIARRISIFDTDSAIDWILIVPGQSSFGNAVFTGTAIPVLFPESKGMPVLDAIYNAKNEILISIYEIDHVSIIYLLSEALKRGVVVKILVEGSPVGGISQTELGLLSSLYRSGADILIMKNNDGFRRYSYLHNKYAVIDSEIVVVTSENWRTSSFTSNRGWGTVIRSQDYAEYMRTVFFEDSNDRYSDIIRFIDLYPGVLPSKVQEYVHVPSVHVSYNVIIEPVVGPDNALDKLNRMIDASEYRIYSEQLTVDISWVNGDSPLTRMSAAANRGVDSRLIIDVTYDSPYDNDTNDGYWVKELMKENNVKIRTSEDCGISGLLHNKGVVIDDSVWIGSMNWNSSFRNNREIAAVIRSDVFADLFAEYFKADWGVNDNDIELNVEVTVTSQGVILDASSSAVPYGAVFEWDLDSDGIIDRRGKKVMVELSAGVHDCVLYVKDDDAQIHEYRFTVIVPDGGGYHPHLKYVPIVALCIMILAYSVIRRRKNDNA